MNGRFRANMFKFILWVTLLGGCAHQRDVGLVKDRMLKLQPLSKYSSTVCDVETRPTQPALARFTQMYPKEIEKLQSEAWTFKWRQRESRCEIVPAQGASSSPVVKAQLGFIEAALCLLAQIFYVNSPFDELPLAPENVERRDQWIRIGAKNRPELGLFLDRKDFLVVTRTQSRGEFAAHYKQFDLEWLPDRMEHKPDNMQILLDHMEYGERVGNRRMLKSLMLSVGTERPLPHSQLLVRNCQRL